VEIPLNQHYNLDWTVDSVNNYFDPFFIIFYPIKRGMDPYELLNSISPLIFLAIFGAYYALSFLIFYVCTRVIHHKKLINLIVQLLMLIGKEC
jgi:hypothetical protein